jgi:hypothetical protein
MGGYLVPLARPPPLSMHAHASCGAHSGKAPTDILCIFEV